MYEDRSAQKTLDEFSVDPKTGLTKEEVDKVVSAIVK